MNLKYETDYKNTFVVLSNIHVGHLLCTNLFLDVMFSRKHNSALTMH